MDAGQSLREELTRLLLWSIREVLPADLHGILNSTKDAVRPTASSRAAADFECRAAASAYARIGHAHRTGTGSTECRSEDAIEFITVSKLGLERHRRFESARALADALLDHLPAESRQLVAHARADENGKLLFCSRPHFLYMRAQGLLHCADCGLFFAGERGLRDHQLVKHQRRYEDAMEAVHVSRTQLIPFSASPSILHAAAAAATAVSGKAEVLADAVAARRNAALERRTACAHSPLDPGLIAAREGNVAALRALIGQGWDPRAATDRHGSNALLWAAGAGALDACVLLVDECGVDPRGAQQKDGRSALHWAARNGQLAVCRWLVLEKGVCVDTPTHDGTVALHWAVWQRQWAVVRWLLGEGGADLHATNSFGCNSIQWAAQSGDVPMCAFLRARGLDVGCLNCNGHSALHKAAIKGHADVCAWLVHTARLGLEHMQADEGGHTPARMARCDGHAELADWLEGEEQRMRREAAEATNRAVDAKSNDERASLAHGPDHHSALRAVSQQADELPVMTVMTPMTDPAR